jgi:CysZ protein
MIGAALSASLKGLGDLAAPALRPIVLGSMALSAALLAGAVWAAIRFGLPLIPEGATWWSGALEAAAEGAAILVAFVLALVLWPIVAMIVSLVFLDVAADRLEARLLPADARGKPPSPIAGAAAGLKFAAVSVPLNLIALPLYFVPVVGLIVAVSLNAFLLSRENYTMAGLRHGDWRTAWGETKARRFATLLAALPAACLAIIPFVNAIVPIWTLAAMIRLRASR